MPEFDPAIDPGLQEAILVSRLGENPSQASKETASFFEEVYRLCIRLIGRDALLGEGAIAFALSENGLDVDAAYEAHSDSFQASGRLDREVPSAIEIGPVVLMTRNLRIAFSASCAKADAFGVAKRLGELGLGARPTAMFVASQRLLTFYPAGVDQKPTLKARTNALAALDPTDLDAVIGYFHDNWTRYPTGCGACWDNATTRVVERNAERNIRNHLFVFLGLVVYRSKFVVREYDRPNGRIDIFIYGIAMNEPDMDRVIELKVLRSRSIGWAASAGKTRSYSDAGNKRYVERGLRQARRYVESTAAQEAFLVCFDARLENVDIAVLPYAQSLGVTYRRYYMESSAKED